MADKTTLVLAREVRFIFGPQLKGSDRVTVNAQVTSQDPLYETLRTEMRPVTVDLPTKGWSEDDVLAAVVAAFPDADVSWQLTPAQVAALEATQLAAAELEAVPAPAPVTIAAP